MSSPEKVSPYAVSLDELEREVHVPVEDQSTEQPTGAAGETSSDWEQTRRETRLAGGA
jgi:hypothetical protein